MTVLASRLLVYSFIIGLIPAVSTAAAFGHRFEFASNTGSTNNLLNDSGSVFDVYTTSALRLSGYPWSSLEISVGGEHSYYRENIGLSSLSGRLSATAIPLPRSSRFSLYMSGLLSGIRYHSDFSGFDNNSGEVQVSAGYNVIPALSFRTGVVYASTSYISLATDDKRDFQVFCGANIIPFGSNSIDIEAGFDYAGYFYIQDDPDIPDILPPDSFPVAESKLRVLYISPRYSRPIGARTGLSVSFTRYKFQNYDKQMIYGFSTQYLSPWASVWEGQSVSLNVKTFLIPKMIVTAGAGYWDKTYMRTAEKSYIFFLWAKMGRARQDWETRYYLSLQRPFTTHGGLFFEPRLSVDYTDNKSNKYTEIHLPNGNIVNKSNKPLYLYSDLSIMFSLTFRM